jgi:hypothetical protein
MTEDVIRYIIRYVMIRHDCRELLILLHRIRILDCTLISSSYWSECRFLMLCHEAKRDVKRYIIPLLIPGLKRHFQI